METRHREQKRFWRKSLLVLQVSVTRKRGTYVDYSGDTLAPPNWDPEEIITTWRDATVTDLLCIPEKPKVYREGIKDKEKDHGPRN